MDNQLTRGLQENTPAGGTADNSTFESLVEQATRGEREALVALCQSIARSVMFRVMRFVRNQEDAEDVAQEVLIRVCENIQKLKEPKAFPGWLNSIILNETRRYIGKNTKYTNVVSIDDYQDIHIEETDAEVLPEECVIQEDERRYVMSVIDGLPERQREAIIQHYYQNLSVVEIARAMQVSHPTISIYLRLAREKIKSELKKSAKNTSAAYSITLMPLGSLLKQVLSEEAAQTPTISSASIHQAIYGSLNHVGNAGEAVVNTAAASTGFLSSGFLMSIAVTFVATAVAVGGLFAGGVFSKQRIPIEPPAAIDITGEIVFSGGDALLEHVNPKQASAWAQDDLGALTSQNWWITATGGGDILYSGVGDNADEALVQMYLSGENGEYELNFRMADETGNTYKLTRQFTIQNQNQQ